MHSIRTLGVTRGPASSPHHSSQTPTPAAAQKDADEDTGGERTFAGLKFGVGLSFTWDVVDRERVNEAVIDGNGIVRVNKTGNAITRIMLESHYLFALNGGQRRSSHQEGHAGCAGGHQGRRPVRGGSAWVGRDHQRAGCRRDVCVPVFSDGHQ